MMKTVREEDYLRPYDLEGRDRKFFIRKWNDYDESLDEDAEDPSFDEFMRKFYPQHRVEFLRQKRQKLQETSSDPGILVPADMELMFTSSKNVNWYVRRWRSHAPAGESFDYFMKLRHPDVRQHILRKKMESIDKEKEVAPQYDEHPLTKREEAERLVEKKSSYINLLKSFGVDDYEVGDTLKVTRVLDKLEQPVVVANKYDQYYGARSASGEVEDNRPRYVSTLTKLEGGRWRHSGDGQVGSHVYTHWGEVVENFLAINSHEILSIEQASGWTLIEPITDGRKLRNM